MSGLIKLQNSQLLLMCSACACLLLLSTAALPQEMSFQNALNIAKQVVADFPKHPESHVVLANVHRAASEWDKAIESYKQSLSIEPNQPDVMISMASAYGKKYEFEKAIEWYQKAVQTKPIQMGWYQHLGLTFIQQNRMTEARDAFFQEVTHFPNNAASHYYLAQRYFEEDRFDLAKKHAMTCMELDERFPEPLYLLASIARKENDRENAKIYFDQFKAKKAKESDYIPEITSEKNSNKSMEAQVHLLAGALYYQNNRDNLAEQHFKSVIALDSKNIAARIHLVQLYSAQRNLQKLEPVLRDLHTLQPQDINYMQKLGELFIVNQNWNEALPLLQKAYSISPATQIKRALSQVLVITQTDPKRGLQLMLEVVQEEPTAHHYDLLSRAFYVNRDLPQCIEAMRMAMELDPNNPTYKQRYQKLNARMK